MVRYVLYESSVGYGLFQVQGVDQVEINSPKFQQSITKFEKFSSVCSLKAFYNFATPEIALENQNDIAEGILNHHLQEFLEQNLGSSDSVAVADTALYNSMEKAVNFKVQKDNFFQEITRAIRNHFPKFIKAYLHDSIVDVDEGYVFKSQRGLAHSYSRAKVKFNVNKSDNMIIQSISTLDHLDKDINTFAMRVREWYSWHFPELVKIANDNILYSRLVRFIGNREHLTEKSFLGVHKIIEDEDKARLIIRAANSSSGYEISEYDLKLIQKFAERVVKLAELRTHLSAYLKTKMLVVAPNLYTLIGETVGARLITKAGSLTNLAKYPSSTVQILGAEKALFRALKNRSNTPKYGLIYHSSYIGRAKAKDKGRISRYIANKCSIASRIDCFSDVPTTKYGECLALQVEERLKFLEEGGPTPEKNIDVMQRVLETLKDAGFERAPRMEVEKTPKKSSSKKDMSMEVEESPKHKKEKKDKKDKKKRNFKG
jgi:nucleolar protein 56